MKRVSKEFIERIVFYTIVFFILLEWLQPIMQLTDTGYFKFFSIFIGLCLIINLFELHWIFSWVLKIGFIAWFITYVYSDFSVFSSLGMQFLFQEFSNNISVLVYGDWAHVSNPFRTSLFFILIWMLIYLIHYWITVRMSIFYFFMLTVFFIAILDTFSDYDGSAAIVKVVLLGLILTALLFLKRTIRSSATEVTWHTYILYVTPVVLLIGVMSIVAVLLPKAEPQWPDPIPYIKGVAGQGESGSGNGSNGELAKVGYGNNDSQLGGSFLDDDTVVFQIKATSKQYWRIETKDLYTSKGWENSDASFRGDTVIELGEEIPLSLASGEDEVQQAVVTSLSGFWFLLQPYRTNEILFSEEIYPNSYLRLNVNSEKLSAYSNQEPISPTEYTVTYQPQEYSYTQLKETTAIGTAETRFLQLPNNLPARVTALAEEITTNHLSVYDKAKAIESYFRRNGFRYETKDVPIPEVGQDYVDQFLFTTKYGYCDNFSTTMVVLLRSVGIPARWVKGFSSGTEIARDTANVKTYEIANNDAHSWVEAYIDGIGWMPFEPTIGFTSPALIDYDLDIPETEPDELLQEEQQLQQQKEEAEVTKSTTTSPRTVGNFISSFKWLLLGGIGVALLLILILFRGRKKWLPKVYVQLNRNKAENAATFETSYVRLLKQLERYGFHRAKGQTLQEYAKQVDAHFETDKMSELTEAYERTIYSGNQEEIDFAKMKESWEYLINLTIG